MIGLLNAYHFDTTKGSYQEKYGPLFLDYLKTIMPDEEIKSFQVAQDVFPKDINECDAWIITGSPASAYDDENWIKSLTEFIQNCHSEKKKILGICFGHQLIAKALGGVVEKSDKGWGIGIKSFDLIEKKKWMTPNLKYSNCSLLFSHQDQVLKLPPDSIHLASDNFCEFQMFSVDDHIFCIQGHPEFTKEYALERYTSRIDIIGEDKFKTAKDTLNLNTDAITVGKWISNFFKQA